MGEDPPDINEEKIRELFEKMWLEKNTELEASIDFEVAKRLETYNKPLVDKVKSLEEKLLQAEKEIKEIRTKKMTFGEVAEKTRLFEGGATLGAPPAYNRARTPSPSARTTVPYVAPAPRQPPRPRRPSITSYTEDIPIEEIRRSFRQCRKEVRISPVTLEHIRLMYVGLTNDHKLYQDSVLATGESHQEARMEAARDFFLDELNMEDHMFQIEKVEYMTDFDKATMIVTMKDEKFATKAFIRKAAVKNQALKVTNSWPSFSFQRRRAIFDLVLEAKAKFPDRIYQARLGAQDLEVHEKNKGGYFHSIPLNMFLEMMGTSQDQIPGFFKAQEKSRGRNPNKRGPPTPDQAERTAAQRPKPDDEATDESSSGEASTGATTDGATSGPVGVSAGGESGAVIDSESIVEGEKTNSSASEDGVL